MASKYEKEAGLVMGTNSSSIVSKRSVERIYYPEPHFFRHFVKKPQRRSPLINRGYWLRMHAIEQSVRQFLSVPSDRPKVVLNFGCGFDPLPFQFLEREPELCRNARFVDVDHHKLMLDKRAMIQRCTELCDLIPDADFLPYAGSVAVRAERYLGIGCDLADIQGLDSALRSEVDIAQSSILCFAEVSLTYMPVKAADALIGWASTLADDVQFSLLEQCFPDGPDHPFAKTMMAHFSKLRTPLHSIHRYPTLRDQERRFVSLGWRQAKSRSLWDLWNDPEYVSHAQATALDSCEAFDEWEELAVFASHYSLLIATTRNAGLRSSSHHSASDVDAVYDPEPMRMQLVARCPPKFSGQTRFAAIVPIDSSAIGLHGGLGRQTRLSSTGVFSRMTVEEAVSGTPPSTVAPRMCHTITELGNSDCLLVGGRSAPTTVLGDCWLRRAGTWRRVGDLPTSLFRHSAVNIQLPTGDDCVLVYGGKTSEGSVSGQFLLWREQTGWQVVEATGPAPLSRFGASLVSTDSRSGIVFGGMDKRGTVLRDLWSWSLIQSQDGALLIELVNKTDRIADATLLWLGRFGASISSTREHAVVIGGISTRGCLAHEHEVLLLGKDSLNGLVTGTGGQLSVTPVFAAPSEPSGPRPLLIGHSSYAVDPGQNVLIVGGGAVCFSFGTYWNEGSWLLKAATADQTNEWVLVEPSATSADQTTATTSTEAVQATSILRVKISSPEEFQEILAAARPVILEGLDVGPCVSLWTKEYLQEKVGQEREVVVHESRADHMNFRTKNFSYVTKKFGQFLDEIHAGSRQYLRAISSDKPTEVPANLSADFPGLKDDFRLPPELAEVSEKAHSSPLRISGPVTLWLHYDVLANVLCQIRGEKVLILYPPWDVSRLALPPGTSSSSIDVFQGSCDSAPRSPPGTNPHEARLKPGDILVIPPLWLHTASPTAGVSVAVNVFFRNLAAGTYAAGRDVYGNRDLQAYEKGRRDVEKIVHSFDRLPRDIARFYLDRLADELKERAST